MPIFEYACDDCGEDFEKLVRSSRKTEIVCPTCNSDSVHKKLSTFASKISGGGSSYSSSSSSIGATCAPGGL